MHPLTFADLMSVERIEGPVVSPRGEAVAYTVAVHDPAKNEVRRTIRSVDLRSGEERELTPGPGNHSAPAFSPDGRRLAFVSTRDDEGAQLWVLPLHGGEARRVTTGYGGVASPVWAPDSRRVVFARSVVVSEDYDEAADTERGESKEPARAKVFGLVNEKSTARVANRLLFRHWDHWRERQRSHVFVVDVDSGELADVTPGDRDAPPISLGSARDFDVHPDGDQLAFVANPDEQVALSTNNSVFVVGLDGVRATGEPRDVSTSAACDNHPRWLADGRLAYLAMATPGYEADRQRLKVWDPVRGETTTLLEEFDRSPHAFQLVDGGTSVLLVAQDRGRMTLYRLDPASGGVRQLTCCTTNSLVGPVPNSDRIVVGRQTTTQPMDLFVLRPGEGIEPVLEPGPHGTDIPPDAGASLIRLTRHGDTLREVAMNPVEDVWYRAAEGDLQHGLVIRPPQFEEGERYPLILLIHGGPQGAFADEFHFRWSAQMFAAQGAVVAYCNPTGSTGYGQALTDAISGDWGGRCYDDIHAFLDYLLQEFPFLDPDRLTAAGASFGGFMINWILGHSDRFKALVCHDGVFFSETMAYTTEELWFETREHGGLPHENRTLHERFSPHKHVARFQTPTLVVHGEQDFRCPVSEGLGLFTALQVKNVPSRFLYFPDEGHWVTKPANAEVWYHEVMGWLMKWVGDPA